MIGEAGRADAGAFLTRLLRLDPNAVVRLRPAGRDRAEIWAMLPFRVLVVRTLATGLDADATFGAAALLDALADPAAPVRRRDEAWRWPLPPSRGRIIETLPAEEVARVAAAASQTLRTASEQGVGGRAVGERVVRDALLDHVPIVVTGAAGEHVDVSQRLVQAVVRMGFLGPATVGPSESVTFGDNLVTVRLAAAWICLDASYGSAWYRLTSPLQLS